MRRVQLREYFSAPNGVAPALIDGFLLGLEFFEVEHWWTSNFLAEIHALHDGRLKALNRESFLDEEHDGQVKNAHECICSSLDHAPLGWI